jgi:hypothetical protein
MANARTRGEQKRRKRESEREQGSKGMRGMNEETDDNEDEKSGQKERGKRDNNSKLESLIFVDFHFLLFFREHFLFVLLPLPPLRWLLLLLLLSSPLLRRLDRARAGSSSGLLWHGGSRTRCATATTGRRSSGTLCGRLLFPDDGENKTQKGKQGRKKND